MRNRFVWALMLTTWAGAHGVSATQGAAGSAALVVDGDVTKALSLTSAELKSLPRTKVEVKAENGTISVYEGVLAGELLQAIFAVTELDPGFTSSNVIVADIVDGEPLSGRQGPLRLVAPKDLVGSRSVRGLRRIPIVRLTK